MNTLELKLQQLNPILFGNFQNTVKQVDLLLNRYSENFPTYTDHSLNHTMQVFKIASEMLTSSELDSLNGEEIYILSMSCILHDIGMCLPEKALLESDRYKKHFELNQKKDSRETMIRDIHHELSYDFIKQEQELLDIPNEKYAEAIALVAMGHRKVHLDDVKLYTPKYFVKDGREFVCLPYLASVIRLADELDITNIRTPKLLTKYYMPNNEKSVQEWQKHISTTQINYTEDQVIFHVNCSDQNNLAALEDQFEKIQDVVNYAQKIIRNISNTDGRVFSLEISKIVPIYKYIGFDPKGIKFSFNVNNVVNTFIGKDLYKNDLTAIREVLQNAIDSCRYKHTLLEGNFTPEISIEIKDNSIIINDNGLGMDEFIIENFFGKLGSSFYTEEEVKSSYDAIGQFGVGVFSYFLLSDFIDIETKTEKHSALKFRIDKDPKNYFHFYPMTTRNSPGTTITLHLTENIKEKYNTSDYVEYVQNRFRYIEFPVKIITESNDYILDPKRPTCLKEKEIQNRIKIQHKDKINNLEVITIAIQNEDFEGECSIILPIINNKSTISYIHHLFSYDAFESDQSFHEYSSISISQKGVYVASYSSEILRYTVGQININKSLPININRNEFSKSEDIEAILLQFELKLIDELFSKINLKVKDDVRVKLSYEFIEYYYQGYYASKRLSGNIELLNTLSNNIWVKVYDNQQINYKTISEFIKSYNEFILISDFEDHTEVYTALKKPLLIVSGAPSHGGSFNEFKRIFIYLSLFKSKLVFDKKKAYLQIECKNTVEKDHSNDLKKIVGYEVSDIVLFDSNLIATSLLLNKPEFEEESNYISESIVNSNHPFIQYVLSSLDHLKKDSELSKTLVEAFEIITNIATKQKKIQESLKQLNTIILPLYDNPNQAYKFKRSDFF